MTNLALNQNLRLTDALERDILENTLNAQSPLHPVTAVKRAARAVAHGVGAFFSFIEEVQDTMSRAQQHNGRYTGASGKHPPVMASGHAAERFVPLAARPESTRRGKREIQARTP